jgi:hypothetical protein
MKPEDAADHHYTRNMFIVAFCQLRKMLLQWRLIICQSVGIWKRWSVFCDGYIYLVIFKSKWSIFYNTFWYSKNCIENLTLGQTDPNHKNNFFSCTVMLNVYHTVFFSIKLCILLYEPEPEVRHMKSQNTNLWLTLLLSRLTVNTIQDTKNQCK